MLSETNYKVNIDDESRQRPSPGRDLIIKIPSSKLLISLSFTTIAICIVGLMANLYIHQIAENEDTKMASLMQRFDLGYEPSIPAYYSAFLMLVCSGLLWVIYQYERKHELPFNRFWLFLSATFFLLSLDEAVMFHEMADGALQKWFNLTGIFYLAWVIPAMAFVAVFFLVSLPFLFQLEARTRNLFLLAGAVFVGGAIGMEMVVAPIVEVEGFSSIKHSFIQTIEEAMEMFGVLIFMYALLRYVRLKMDSVSLDVVSLETEPIQA